MGQQINKKDIDIEIDLLKSMSKRSNFETYYGSIDTKRIFPSTKLMLKDYKKYFELYDHGEVDFKSFYTPFKHLASRILRRETFSKEVERKM